MGRARRTNGNDRAGAVRLLGLGRGDEGLVREILGLVGAREWDGEGEAALVVAAPGAPATPGVPRVEVGEEGQFLLPQDLEALAEAILGALSRRGGDRARLLGVAGWGGAAASDLALGLAAGLRGVLVDASGSAPAPALLERPEAPGIRWADLDPAERAYGPDLVDRLARAGRARVLSGDARGVAEGSDPRLAPVVESIRAKGLSAVVDLGTWGPRAARARGLDGIVLVGRGDLRAAARLSCALGFAPPGAPCVLVLEGGGRGRIRAAAPGLAIVSRRAALRREGRALLDGLARAGGRQWAREWSGA